MSHILSEPEISLYRLASHYAPNLEIHCVSTPYTRQILNQPRIRGVEFTRALQEAVTLTLRYFPDQEEKDKLKEENTGIINFLRSGLNFGIREALYNAWNFNNQLSSFITSQRDRDQFGRWFIRDDAYRKIELPPESTIFIGEIVATGVTMTNGLEIIGQMAKNLGQPIRNLVFFTIGCHKIEKALTNFDQMMRDIFPGYHKTYLFYFEGKFHLADSKTKAQIKIQGTDLMRFPALLAPEFEQTQFSPLLTPLERCVIYDGGARAFNPGEHMAELTDYWREMIQLGEQGMSLKQALNERWPAPEYQLEFDEFLRVKQKSWPDLDETKLMDLYRAGKQQRDPDFEEFTSTPGSLAGPARERLALLKQSLQEHQLNPEHRGD